MNRYLCAFLGCGAAVLTSGRAWADTFTVTDLSGTGPWTSTDVDRSPSLASTAADGVWLAWSRAMGTSDHANCQLNVLHLNAGATTLTAGPTVVGALTVAISHDGTRPIVFFGRSPSTFGTQIDAWLPEGPAATVAGAGLTVPVTEMFVARDGARSRFVLALLQGAAGTATSLVLSGTPPYATLASLFGPTYVATAVGVSASSATGTARVAFAESPQVQIEDPLATGTMPLPTIPGPAIRVAVESLAGSYVYELLNSPSMASSYIETPPSPTVTPSVVASGFPGSATDIALAPDPARVNVWSFTLLSSPLALVVLSPADLAPSVNLLLQYSACRHLTAATDGARPDVAFAAAACTSTADGTDHAVLFTVVRTPDAGTPDAGVTDAAITDGSDADAAVPLDAAVNGDSGPNSGLAFRGGGCSCRAPASAVPVGRGIVTFGLALTLRRRRRR